MNTNTIILNDTKFTETFGRSKSTFIKRLHFWINKAETKMSSIGIIHGDKRWIYNTAEEWGKQIGYSERQTQRIISDLIKEKVVLLEKLGRYKKTNTNFYTLNYEKLTELDLATVSAPKEIQRTKKEVIAVTTTPTNSSSTGTEPHMRSKPSNTTVQDMHAIWNSTFPNNQTSMTKDLGRYLYAAYKNNFNYNMEEWEKYCVNLSVQNPNGLSIETALKFNTLNHYKNNQNKVSTQACQGQVSQGAICSAISTQLPESEIDISKSQEMLEIWNQIFENKSSSTMTQELKILLGQALKDQFKSRIDEWKCYCLTIKTSKWIMGSEFKLHLKWALRQETIEKIKNKCLGVTKIIVPYSSTIDTITDHLSKIETQEDEFCLHIRKTFIKIYGERVYTGWLMRVGLRIENRQLIIVTENQYVKDQISLHYKKIFQYVAKNAPKDVNQQQEDVDQSLQDNTKKNIRPHYTKTVKLVHDNYFPHLITQRPHDIKQRSMFDIKGYLDKTDIILKYIHTKPRSIPQTDINKISNATLLEVSNSSSQQETHHLKKEGRAGAETTTTKTLQSIVEHNSLSECDVCQKTDDTVSAGPINVALDLPSTKIQCEVENLCLIKSKNQINTINLNHEYFYKAKKSTPEFTTTNVVKGRGALRQDVVLHNTVITNQQNNNLIRGTNLTNDQVDFTTLGNESNQQVRNYYLKNINWKKEDQRDNPKRKHTKRKMGVFKKEADLNKKTSCQSHKNPRENWKHNMQRQLRSCWNIEKYANISKIIIQEEFSGAYLLNLIKNINPKSTNPKNSYNIFPSSYTSPELEMYSNGVIKYMDSSFLKDWKRLSFYYPGRFHQYNLIRRMYDDRNLHSLLLSG